MATPKFDTSKSIDIDELIKQSKANTPFVDEATLERAKKENVLAKARADAAKVEVEEEPVGNPVKKATPKPPVKAPVDDGLILEEEPEETVAEPEYEGPGIVMSKEEYEKSQANKSATGMKVSEIKEETMDSIKSYMKDQDAEIKALKQKRDEMEAKGVVPATRSPQNIVNIYIDKAQVGNISLTPEQQKKVEMANKIVVTETTELNFKTIKIKRDDADKGMDRKRKDTIIKRAFDRTLAPFIALGSGYLGKMGNCSVAEIMKLGRQIDSGRNLKSELERWSLLYDKMKYCSIGKFESFDDFLKNTAYTDYDNLQFALIVASFPTDTTLQFTCPRCNNVFNVTIPNKDLLRTDLVDPEIAQTVQDIFNADTFIERAKEVHEKALFNQVKRISANEKDNLILLDLYLPSAYDAIHRTYEQLTNPRKDDEDYSSYVDLVRMIKSVFIADTEEIGEDGEPVYYRFDDVNDIFDIVSNFTEDQINKIGQFLQNSYVAHQYYYGIKEVVCTNEACKHNLGEYPMSMDTLLFHKVRPQQQ